MSYHLPPSHPPVARVGACGSSQALPDHNRQPTPRVRAVPRRTKAQNRCVTAAWMVRNWSRQI
ncbi:MAG TPA: hypothetical protein VFF65_02835 [Phycisphaerales bacterium]|nr:hypothetical protein [Phycisphaerales bacterium]